jgi:predicted dehydrogenase
VDKCRAEATAGEFGVPDAKVFTDYKKLYKGAAFDAVYVGLPPFAHEEQELIAARQGIHLFVEKPVALSMELANKVSKAVVKAGIISSAGFQDRYQDIMPYMKNWLAKKDIAFINGYWVGGMPGVWWWRRREHSGGQAVEQTIHIFDMVRYLFGDVVAVQAFGRRGVITDVENYDTEDASAVNLQFENGIIGTVYSGCFTNCGGKCGIDIYCKNARLDYTERAGFKAFEPNLTIDMKTGNDYGQEEDDAFIDAILEKDQSLILSPYSEAVKDLEVALAANESMDNGGKLIRLK